MRGAGGTSGGVGTFFLGLAMVVVGYYLLLPLLAGIGWLFYDGRSIGGWMLAAAGALIILAGIIANLHLYFAPTSLFDTLVMLGLLAAGLGLVARSLRAQA